MDLRAWHGCHLIPPDTALYGLMRPGYSTGQGATASHFVAACFSVPLHHLQAPHCTVLYHCTSGLTMYCTVPLYRYFRPHTILYCTTAQASNCTLVYHCTSCIMLYGTVPLYYYRSCLTLSCTVPLYFRPHTVLYCTTTTLLHASHFNVLYLHTLGLTVYCTASLYHCTLCLTL